MFSSDSGNEFYYLILLTDMHSLGLKLSSSCCLVMQIVRDELVKLMGGEVSELVFAKSGPTVILLAGLQGVGKTTVSAKLAFYLKKQVHD